VCHRYRRNFKPHTDTLSHYPILTPGKRYANTETAPHSKPYLCTVAISGTWPDILLRFSSLLRPPPPPSPVHYNSKQQGYRIITTHLCFIFMVYLTIPFIPLDDKCTVTWDVVGSSRDSRAFSYWGWVNNNYIPCVSPFFFSLTVKDPTASRE
jgi:hypothetical protein